MKRTILVTMILAAALVCSCKKDGRAGAPSVTWAANSNFATMEMAPAADGAVSLNAPGAFESITLTLGLGDLNLTANPYIGVSANKSSGSKSNPVFDVIDDSTVASFLQGLGMTAGTGLRGKTIATLDLLTILEKLIEGQPLSNNTNFTIAIDILDQNGKSFSKTAKFHYTSAPSFSWDGNSSFDAVDLNSTKMACKVKVSAPGKIARLTVTLEPGADSRVTSNVKNRTASSSTVIDLVNDEKAAENFEKYFPAGKGVTDKTDVTLDFAFMYDWAPDMQSSTNVFTIFVEDQNAKTASTIVKFTK